MAAFFVASRLDVLHDLVEAVSPDEIEGNAVDAIAQTSGRGAIFEHVPQVPATSPTNHFHASHAVAQIDVSRHATTVRGLKEAWPTAVAFEFGPRIKQLGAACHADVHAIFVMQPEFSGKPRLRALFFQHMVGFRAQDPAPTLFSLGRTGGREDQGQGKEGMAHCGRLGEFLLEVFSRQ